MTHPLKEIEDQIRKVATDFIEATSSGNEEAVKAPAIEIITGVLFDLNRIANALEDISGALILIGTPVMTIKNEEKN